MHELVKMATCFTLPKWCAFNWLQACPTYCMKVAKTCEPLFNKLNHDHSPVPYTKHVPPLLNTKDFVFSHEQLKKWHEYAK